MNHKLFLLVIVLLAALALPAGWVAADSAAPQIDTAGDSFPIGPVESSKGGPVADMDAAGNMIVAWDQSDGGAFVQRLNADGSPNGEPILTKMDEDATAEDLSAGAAGNFVIVWDFLSDRLPAGRCFSAEGVPMGTSFSLGGPLLGTDEYGKAPSVEMAPDGSFVAVWEEAPDPDQEAKIMGRRFSAACAALGDPFFVADGAVGYEQAPDIAMDAAGNFIVVWQMTGSQQRNIFARYFDADGAPRGGQFRVSPSQASSPESLSVGMDAAGNAVIAFTSQSETPGGDSNLDVLIRRFDAAGRPMGKEFSPYSRPSYGLESLVQIAVAPSGEFAVLWTQGLSFEGPDLWLQAYDASGAAIGPRRLVTAGEENLFLGALATWSGDTYLAAWTLPVAQGQSQIYGRLINLDDPVDAHSYQPANDAYVMEARPNNAYGSQKVLQVKDASKDVDTYVQFNVNDLNGSVEYATLRLYVNDPSPDGGAVYAVSPFYKDTTTLWLESGLNWNNAPAISGTPLDDVGGATVRRQWVELDVTAAVVAAQSGDGHVSLALVNDSRNLLKYSSSESANSPELIVYTD